jgi:hypothetical protein
MPNNPPVVPLQTGVTLADIDLLFRYLLELQSYLLNGEHDATWVTTGVVTDQTLTVGDTLTATQHVLGTVINTLANKGVL